MFIDDVLKKEKEEGKEAVTSPAQEPVESNVLSNTPTPTTEEKEDAGLISDIKPKTEEETEQVQAQEENEPVQNQELNTKSILEPVQVEQQELKEENGVVSGTATQMFTQSQVDEIAGKTRKEAEARTLKKVYSRYGVNNEEELDDLFGNAQRYDTLKEEYDLDSKNYKSELDSKNKAFQELSEQVALLRSGIDENRFEDATFILRGKGLEVTLDNIKNELATHPEWKSGSDLNEDSNLNSNLSSNANLYQKKSNPTPTEFTKPNPNPTRLSVLGNNGADTPTPELSERDIALKKIFKV